MVIRQYVICLCLCPQGILSANVDLISSRSDINKRYHDLKKDCDVKDAWIADLEAARKKDEGKITEYFLPSAMFCVCCRQSFS